MKKQKIYLNKTFLLSAFVGIAIIFIIFQFSIPQVKQILAVRQSLKQEKGRLEQLVQKSTALENLDEQELKDNFQVTQDSLPSEKDIAGLLYTLARLENETSVTIEGIELQPGLISTPSANLSITATPSAETKGKAPPPKTKPSGGSETIDFEINVSGSFLTVRNLLSKITEINPLLTISSVSFSGEGGNVKAEISLSYNYQLLQSLYVNVEDPLPLPTNKDKEALSEVAKLPLYSKMPAVVTSPGGKVNPFE